MDKDMIYRIINFIILLGIVLYLPLSALFTLRKRSLSARIKLGWSLVIILFPILGSIVFWIVNPNKEASQSV
jgi:hypothetical protein